MLFPTLNFALFFLLVFTVAWALVDRPRARLLFLCAASYVFYGWTDWRFVFLLGGSTLFNHLAGRAVFHWRGTRWGRPIIAGAVAVNLAVLGFYKYAGFATQSLNDLLSLLGSPVHLPFLDILLPVGISFFTFHGISYLVDLYRGDLPQPASLSQLLLYISFFPQLVAGPIVRASHFLPQIGETPDPDDIRAGRAYLLILGGLFKKVVAANTLATDLVDPVFHDPGAYGAPDLLFATYGYALQIYCDFSAYTDIAIGVAALLGYRFPRNFNQPYRAVDLRDFWKRWHISLSSWLRDYLYIPLGGNRGGWKRYRNLMITMLLGGLWHGAAWNFVIWGGLHGAMLVVEHLWEGWRSAGAAARPAAVSGWRRALGVALTFHFVCLTWIFFRSADLGQALGFLSGFADWGRPVTQLTPLTALLLAGMMAAQFLPADRLARLERVLAPLPLMVKGAAAGLVVLLIDACGPDGVAPFIYFQF